MDLDTRIGGPNARFPETRSSAISAAASGDAARMRPGQEAIVAAYWKPVYRYIGVRWRKSNEDAKDLTQGFFTGVLEKNTLQGYDAAKGSFRTFLRTCLDRYLVNEYKFEHRHKRSADLVPLDFDVSGPESPDTIFEREWTRGLFDQAVGELRSNLESRGRGVCLAVFERYDLAEEPPSYEQLARDFSITPATVANYLGSARRELRKLVLLRIRSVTGNEREFRREARAILK